MAETKIQRSDTVEDVTKYEELANNMYVYGSVSLVLAMAKETNLIHGLCTAQQPLSSTVLASQLKLKERYVREALNSLTAAGLVQLEAGTGGNDGKEAKYWVPHSCRQVLQNFGSYCLAISTSARQFAGVRECFDKDGPSSVRYGSNCFDTFDEFAMLLLEPIVEGILQTPGLKELLEKGLQALEVGCGTGRLSLRLASMFPHSQFTLSDVSSEALDRARQLAENEGLTNVSFRILDLCQAPDDLKDTFDWVVVSDVIHDLPHPLKALQGICKALKPGCHFSFVDEFVAGNIAENVDCKDVAVMYSQGMFICIPESYQQADSEALGPCWGTEKAMEYVKKAGMNVLGLTRSEELGAYGVCMCQKPE